MRPDSPVLANLFNGGVGTQLYLSERDSDMALLVEYDGRTWHFPAHRLVLRTMSKVFRKMLEHDMAESKSKQVVIQDTTPLAIKQFLKYIYIGSTDLRDWQEILELLALAHKYDVIGLLELCEKQLVCKTRLTNVCVLHEASRTFSLKSLKKETQNLILDAGFVVTATEGFFNLEPKSVEYFLKNERFNVCNESSILDALREWAISECSRRCKVLTSDNILDTMIPLMKYINWGLIPENDCKVVPRELIEKHRGVRIPRIGFHVPPSLQQHMNVLKYIIELGSFSVMNAISEPHHLVRFYVDTYIFITGFRMVGLFRTNFSFGTSPSTLTLGKEGARDKVQFNLSSLPWKNGCTQGDFTWKEIVAYLPYPAKVEPLTNYLMEVRSISHVMPVKWPKTRLEKNIFETDMGHFSVYSFGSCSAITELHVLPAPDFGHTIPATFSS